MNINLTERLIIPTYDDESYVKFGKVEIDREKCNGCGMCALICPGDALCIDGEGKDKKAAMVKINPQCMSCNNCQAMCKRGAIRVTQIYDYGYHFKTIDRGELLKPRFFTSDKGD